MPDEPQNPIPEESPIPASPQEPTEPALENTTHSEPSNMPSEAPESPINTDIPISPNNDNPQNEPISTPNSEETKPKELPAEDGKTEGISEPIQTPETRTAQIPVNEPLASEPEPIQTQSKFFLVRELLTKARNAIQFRKRKKLDKIMTLFLKKSKITNDEVREFLHVSDATAERYLNALEKENKIKQVGKTGKAVSYSRI